jgi:hypothetical protein
MKRHRITLRKLMIAVALAALASWGVVLWERSRRFADEACKHFRRFQVCTINRDGAPLNSEAPRPTWDQLSDHEKEQRVGWNRWVLYEKQLVRKYQRAARFPWITVEEDPPPPSDYRP